MKVLAMRLSSLALGLLSMLVIGTFLPGLIRPALAIVQKCNASTTSGCATCTSTSNVYQCRPPALPTGVIYGTCPAVAGGCDTGSFVAQDCGNTDWTCADPPVSINDSTACLTEIPHCCRTP